MKIVTLLTTILLIYTTIPVIIYANERIPSIKAPFHVGETLMVCGKVAKVTKLNKRTILNIGQTYPNEDIGFLIWDSDIEGFNQRFDNLNTLENK